MSFNHSLANGTVVGFVPNRLYINGSPAFSVFPLNVLFSCSKQEGSGITTGYSLYEPDLGSFKKTDAILSMEYHNVYGGKSWLTIEYDTRIDSYVGKKEVEGKFAGMATGSDWNMFFVHFTALGLARGEKCEFRS